MHILQKTAVVLCLAGVAGLASAAGFSVDGTHSTVNFSTVKKQYVVEPAQFKTVSGTIDAQGAVTIDIALSSIETNVPIRNTRLQTLFFNVLQHPTATLKAQIDMAELMQMPALQRLQIPATLQLYGNSKTLTLDVLAAKVAGGQLLVTSMQPVIVNAQDYGVPAANLASLANTVSNIPISDRVGVNFVISFVPAH